MGALLITEYIWGGLEECYKKRYDMYGCQVVTREVFSQ